MNPKYKNVFMNAEEKGPAVDYDSGNIMPGPPDPAELQDENSENAKPYSPGPTITSRLKELGANSKAQTVGAALKDFPSGGGGGTSGPLEIEIHFLNERLSNGMWNGATYKELVEAYDSARLVRATVYVRDVVTYIGPGYVGRIIKNNNPDDQDDQELVYAVKPFNQSAIELKENGSAFKFL